MPNVTPAGPLAVAVDSLVTLISNVPFFQTWTGAGNAAAALPFIFEGEIGFPIVQASISNGVLTVQTREPHNVQAGAVVTIEGAAIGTESQLNVSGPQTVVSVSADTLTFSVAGPNLTNVYPDGALLVPCVRPLAVVCEANDGLNGRSIGTGGASVLAGALEILIEADVSTQYQQDARNALMEARNAYGQFVQGLIETQETGNLMFLSKVEPVSGPDFTNKADQNDNANRFERWRALVRVTWGLEG